MKLLTIILILTMICTPAKGAFQHSIDMSSGSRIGYTTNYGNTFGRSTQQTYSVNYYRQTYYSGTYTPSYGSGSTHPCGPRKSPGQPDPNGNIADWWRMNMPNWLGGDSNWPDYVEDDYWSVFWELYGDTEYGDYAQEWWEQNHPGETPPWAVPIEDPDIPIITTLLFSYFIYNYMKKRRQQFLLYT